MLFPLIPRQGQDTTSLSLPNNGPTRVTQTSSVSDGVPVQSSLYDVTLTTQSSLFSPSVVTPRYSRVSFFSYLLQRWTGYLFSLPLNLVRFQSLCFWQRVNEEHIRSMLAHILWINVFVYLSSILRIRRPTLSTSFEIWLFATCWLLTSGWQTWICGRAVFPPSCIHSRWFAWCFDGTSRWSSLSWGSSCHRSCFWTEAREELRRVQKLCVHVRILGAFEL